MKTIKFHQENHDFTVLSLKCHGIIFSFFTGKIPCEIHTMNFQNSPVTNVSLYHGKKQSDKWRVITQISPQFFNFFSCDSISICPTLSAPQNVCEPQNVGFWFDVHWNLFSVFADRKLWKWIAYEYINISKSNSSLILMIFLQNQRCFSKVTFEFSVKFSIN